MSSIELPFEDSIRERANKLTVGQLAWMATGSAIGVGVLIALIGLTIDLNRNQVIIVVAGCLLFAFLGTAHAFFRAMLLSATKKGGKPTDAMTYPLFPALLILVAMAVSIFISVYVHYAG
jgi:hypothetical protein